MIRLQGEEVELGRRRAAIESPAPSAFCSSSFDRVEEESSHSGSRIGLPPEAREFESFVSKRGTRSRLGGKVL